MLASTPPSPFLLKKRLRAFTLLEVSFAVAIFALFAVGSIYALNLANRFANNSRYRTLAMAAAQQRLDLAMTTPWSTNTTPAAVLRVDSGVAGTTGNTKITVGTDSQGRPQATTEESSLPLNNDAFNAETGLGSAFTNYDVQVFDKRTTVITKLMDASGNDPAKGANSRLLRINVTVSYTYRSKPYSVTLSSLRTADNF